MSGHSSIVVKNIYYMLAYAFRALKAEQYAEVATEEFDHVHDLFAAILSRGIARQLKQGLHREYVVHAEDLTTLRGKIDLPRTAALAVSRRKELACEFDELSQDNLFNQILRSTSMLLIRHGEVGVRNRAALKRLMPFFADVNDIELTTVPWSTIRFSRANRSYVLLISICQMVSEGMLLTTERGDHRLMSFVDDQQMSRLYEKFILAYFARHWPMLRPRASLLEWALDGDEGWGEGEGSMLPVMQSDIMLSDGEHALIIDAKYYSQNTQVRFDRETVRSANLYQIFAYVENRAATGPEQRVSGMLLYARTDREVQPEGRWRIDGHDISVTTLDLDQQFTAIADKLDGIACAEMGLPRSERVP